MTETTGSSHPKEKGFDLREPSTCVLIVEDFEPMRQYLRSAIQQRPEFRIVAEVADGIDAVQKAGELQPHLILLDIGLLTLDGIQAARRIKEGSPQSRILFVTENRSPDVAEEALRSGGDGYVLKSSARTDLYPAIDAVFQGQRFVSAGVAQRLSDSADDGASDRDAESTRQKRR
jgi:DNA-binding NarL/FixJ family response regulator